ncbi:NUDIX hydrolase [Puniceicoccus vermicola]|uniref:GDP-mannose pyrophosphatase n=1 Tax=Puniceicoccus vermicola TaxID=388746 RepID=A0A7X1AXZ1_9BACT|nr:NUDIX hydrolase [Puniceicoccus vermicola]MBC2600885.1 NUDIX hydrolase [Puniceicoccus vermicola]
METGKIPSAWKVEEVQEVADCRVFRVITQKSRREDDGRVSDWYVVDTNDFVNVVAITLDDELVMVRQFRHGSEEFSLELPGGMVDDGENPLDAGVRELREETGFAGGTAKIFADCHPNPAIMNNRCHYVLVPQAKLVDEVDWDEHEEMEVILLPMKDVREACRRGEITHSLTLAALMRYSLLEG